MDYKDLLKEVSLKLAGAINPGFAGISPFLSLLKDANNQTTNTSTATGTPAVVAPPPVTDVVKSVIKDNMALPSQNTVKNLDSFSSLPQDEQKRLMLRAMSMQENGGRYSGYGDDGNSYGKYQFSKDTWSRLMGNADIKNPQNQEIAANKFYDEIIASGVPAKDVPAVWNMGIGNYRLNKGYSKAEGALSDWVKPGKFDTVKHVQGVYGYLFGNNASSSTGNDSNSSNPYSSPTITSDASSSYLDQTLKQLQSDSGLTLSEADKQARTQLAVEDPNNPFGSYQKQFNSMLKTEFDTMKLYETQWGDSLARLDSNVSAVLKEADSLTSELNRASRQSRIEQGGTEYLPTVLADEIVLNKLAQRSYILDKMNETEKMRNDIISNLQNSRFQSIKQITGLLDDYNKTKDSIRTDLLTMDKNSRAEKQQLYNLIKSENQNTLQQDRETRLTNQTLYTNAIGQIESQAPGVALVQDPAERKAKIDSLVSQYSAMLSKQGVTPEQLRGVIEGYITSYRVKNGLENVTNTTGNIVTLTPPTANTTSTTTQATDLLSSYGII